MFFKRMKAVSFGSFFTKNLLGYILIIILSFVFIKIDFDNKSYMLNANSICAADLMYSIKDNLLFITIITAVIIYINFNNYNYNFSYNIVLRYSKRKHLYRYQLFKIVIDSLISTGFVLLILFSESLLLTKKIINWDLENSYYGFVNGKTYNHTFFWFCVLLIIYIFSFICSQMLIGLIFSWKNINNYYIFFSLFIFVGIIMMTNRMLLKPEYSNYGLTLFNICPYISFFMIIIGVSISIVLYKTVPKREFFY